MLERMGCISGVETASKHGAQWVPRVDIKAMSSETRSRVGRKRRKMGKGKGHTSGRKAGASEKRDPRNYSPRSSDRKGLSVEARVVVPPCRDWCLGFPGALRSTRKPNQLSDGVGVARISPAGPIDRYEEWLEGS